MCSVSALIEFVKSNLNGSDGNVRSGVVGGLLDVAKRYLLAAATVALCLAATTSAGTAVRYGHWRYTLTGVQVIHWTTTAHFDRTDGEGTCDITHHGDWPTYLSSVSAGSTLV